MKTIKQIITVVAFAMFMLGSFSGNAQTSTILEDVLKPLTTIQIPTDFKSGNSKYSKENVNIFIPYVSSISSYVYVEIDNNGKIVTLKAPSKYKLKIENYLNNQSNKSSGRKLCSEMPANWGVVLCMLEVIFGIR